MRENDVSKAKLFQYVCIGRGLKFNNTFTWKRSYKLNNDDMPTLVIFENTLNSDWQMTSMAIFYWYFPCGHFIEWFTIKSLLESHPV